ncbi:DUF2225 domain-containing protein [Alkalihalophilus sp. As8PL]|uniref:DUF2225 domain-containing protein n=1 Tax=Alkalihalophilus sp. As8PL TaxID=3237103 RepID=A0AB39BWR7_9BACI
MNGEIKPLYDKECTCMACNQTFVTKRLRTRFVKVKKIHSNFFTEYKIPSLNPSYYEVSVCPYCGFASTEMFSSTFPVGTKEAIKDQFSLWQRQEFGGERTPSDAIRTMKLGLISASLKKEKSIVIAGLCLRLAWLYRGTSNHKEEERYLAQALKYYRDSYQHADYIGTQMTDMRILYLIAELLRKLGNQAEAIRYFSEVIHHKNRALEANLVEMAREQWYIMRQDIKEVDNH